MAATTETEYNFKKPNGEYGAQWTKRLSDIQGLAGDAVEALRSLGATGQNIEIVSRTKTTDYSEESNHSTLTT